MKHWLAALSMSPGIVVALNPTDYEAMTLVRASTGQFLATDANLYADPKGSTLPRYEPTALLSLGCHAGAHQRPRHRAGRGYRPERRAVVRGRAGCASASSGFG